MALKKFLPNFILNYLEKGNERSVKAKKNIALSFVLKGLNIIISITIVPLTINYVDKMQYGIWLTLSSLIALFGFFDIGFGNGLRNKFSEAITNRKYKLARIYVSTTYAILSIISGIMLILFLCINPFLNWATILNTPQYLAGELSIVAIVVIVFFCMQFVLQLVIMVLSANQQPAKAAFFNFIGNALALLLIFILTKTTKGKLIYLSLALGLSPVVVLVASSLWLYTHEYKLYAPSIKLVQFRFGKRLINLGVKFFVIQIAAIILYQTSNIIITQLYGPGEVTTYNITYKYCGVISMLFGIIITPFWSAFTEAWIKKDIFWINNAMKKLKLIWLLLSVLTIFMVVCANKVYLYWVGESISIPFSLNLTMAAFVIINLWFTIYAQFLNGIGFIKIQLIIAVICSLINIPLSIFLGMYLGIYGVILSTVIVSIPGLIIYPIQFKKIIQKKAHGIWAN